MISSDLKENIKNININTLLIWGELDTYTPLSD
jgi:pimeloyl-ACP methyl ester carboxylesterase